METLATLESHAMRDRFGRGCSQRQEHAPILLSKMRWLVTKRYYFVCVRCGAFLTKNHASPATAQDDLHATGSCLGE